MNWLKSWLTSFKKSKTNPLYIDFDSEWLKKYIFNYWNTKPDMNKALVALYATFITAKKYNIKLDKINFEWKYVTKEFIEELCKKWLENTDDFFKTMREFLEKNIELREEYDKYIILSEELFDVKSYEDLEKTYNSSAILIDSKKINSQIDKKTRVSKLSWIILSEIDAIVDKRVARKKAISHIILKDIFQWKYLSNNSKWEEVEKDIIDTIKVLIKLRINSVLSWSPNVKEASKLFAKAQQHFNNIYINFLENDNELTWDIYINLLWHPDLWDEYLDKQIDIEEQEKKKKEEKNTISISEEDKKEIENFVSKLISNTNSRKGIVAFNKLIRMDSYEEISNTFLKFWLNLGHRPIVFWYNLSKWRDFIKNYKELIEYIFYWVKGKKIPSKLAKDLLKDWIL